jgi:hypothetical protein
MDRIGVNDKTIEKIPGMVHLIMQYEFWRRKRRENKMTYREMAVKTVKLAGQELIDRAEELIPNATNVRNIDIWIRIPSLSSDTFDVPEIEVQTDVYPSRVTFEKYVDLLHEVKE